MATLSFDKGSDKDAVAVVRGGDYDGEVLYLHPQNHTSTRLAPRKEISAVRFASELKGFKPTERVKVINRLQEALDKDLEPDALVGETPAVVALYKKVKEQNSNDKSIELPTDSIFQPIPTPDKTKRQVWYVAGASGSGKSYFARGIAENYKKLYPEREVYLISQLEYDETLDKMKTGKPKRIRLQSLIDDAPVLDEFKDCLIIFDDFDTLKEPYGKAVHNLIEMLCIQGRHSNTSMLILSHYLTNYKKTRLILGEAHYIVLYPMATSFKAMKYVCETHCGLSGDEIQGLKKLGRWVCIHKCFPQYILSEHSAYMLNQ